MKTSVSRQSSSLLTVHLLAVNDPRAQLLYGICRGVYGVEYVSLHCTARLLIQHILTEWLVPYSTNLHTVTDLYREKETQTNIQNIYTVYLYFMGAQTDIMLSLVAD
jgi:hypothetical protein